MLACNKFEQIHPYFHHIPSAFKINKKQGFIEFSANPSLNKEVLMLILLKFFNNQHYLFFDIKTGF
jgi:hypothetical protein